MAMNPALRLKQILLVLGDVATLYAALFLTLFIRYGVTWDGAETQSHFQPFSILFALWLLVFYVNGLYEIGKMKNTGAFLKNLLAATFVSATLSVAFFYFVTVYGITPKTNLFIFLVFAFVFMYLWRTFYNNALGQHLPVTTVAFFRHSPITKEITHTLLENPQLGYRVKDDIESADLIIVPPRAETGAHTTTLYRYVLAGVEVTDTTTFYELVFGKLPIAELEEAWFLKSLANRHTLYDFFRTPVEMLMALVILAIASPIMAIVAILIKLTSRGPAIFKQVRVGEFGKEFTLYKFRSMVANAADGSAEAGTGAVWKTANDPRFTTIGRLIERTHLDELPQLINILTGEASFVGPRPERPTFVEELKTKIPYYELRHLVRPGITGSAQLQYKYGASVEDAYQKLQYDLYYLKNRSFLLDLSIVLKTLKLFFVRPT
ncbi:MAG: sugar transferase [Candidatus Pacebacteria bacterium]|nr:sugar transferase [Candidatus Paceibacterota bacterium]